MRAPSRGQPNTLNSQPFPRPLTPRAWGQGSESHHLRLISGAHLSLLGTPALNMVAGWRAGVCRPFIRDSGSLETRAEKQTSPPQAGAPHRPKVSWLMFNLVLDVCLWGPAAREQETKGPGQASFRCTWPHVWEQSLPSRHLPNPLKSIQRRSTGARKIKLS